MLFVICEMAIQEHVHHVRVVQNSKLTGNLVKTIRVGGVVAGFYVEALQLRVEALFISVVAVTLFQLGGNDLRFLRFTCTSDEPKRRSGPQNGGHQ